MRIALILHWGDFYEDHLLLVKYRALIEVSFAVSQCTARTIDSTPDLNGLMVPQGNLLIELKFMFGHPLKIEKHYII